MRYTVKEEESFKTFDGSMVRVFSVTGGRKDGNVWVGHGDPPECIVCQCLLYPSSRSCEHARAVKRFLAKTRKP